MKCFSNVYFLYMKCKLEYFSLKNIFVKYLLSTFCMLGTVAIASFTLINKRNLFCIQVSKDLSWEMDNAKQIYNYKIYEVWFKKWSRRPRGPEGSICWAGMATRRK